MPNDVLTLPTSVKLSLSMKQIGIIALGILLVAGIIFLVVSGQWRVAQKLMLKLRLKQRELELDRLDQVVANNDEKIKTEAAIREKLDVERKRIEKAQLETQLEIDGKSHDEIVAALRDRGW